MADIINLNRVRKAKAKLLAAQAAKAARAQHGRTAAEKANDQRTEQRREDALDGKLQRDPT